MHEHLVKYCNSLRMIEGSKFDNAASPAPMPSTSPLLSPSPSAGLASPVDDTDGDMPSDAAPAAVPVHDTIVEPTEPAAKLTVRQSTVFLDFIKKNQCGSFKFNPSYLKVQDAVTTNFVDTSCRRAVPVK